LHNQSHVRRLAACLVLLACAAVPGAAHAPTIWLCRPGLASNPCASSLLARVVRADGSSTLQRAPGAASCGRLLLRLSDGQQPADPQCEPRHRAGGALGGGGAGVAVLAGLPGVRAVNIALGNLVGLVQDGAAAYGTAVSRRGRSAAASTPR
jgi:hypothetical protein